MEISYFVAMSLDGFIAEEDGGIDWLSMVAMGDEDYGYNAFYAGVELIILGRLTYEQALTFPEWPYSGKRTIVMSRGGRVKPSPDIEISRESPEQLAVRLAGEGVKKAWMVGGGKLAGAFRQAGLLNDFVISIIPALLGAGIPLSPGGGRLEPLTLLDVERFRSGLVQLHYKLPAAGG